MELNISIIFTLVILIFFLALSIHAAMTRRNSGIALGESNNEDLIRAVRAHGNFLEYTPLFLISFILLEILKVNNSYLIWIACFFILGRVFHAYSMFAKRDVFRALGMVFTFIPYLSNIIYLISLYL